MEIKTSIEYERNESVQSLLIFILARSFSVH